MIAFHPLVSVLGCRDHENDGDDHVATLVELEDLDEGEDSIQTNLNRSEVSAYASDLVLVYE